MTEILESAVPEQESFSVYADGGGWTIAHAGTSLGISVGADADGTAGVMVHANGPDGDARIVLSPIEAVDLAAELVKAAHAADAGTAGT